MPPVLLQPIRPYPSTVGVLICAIDMWTSFLMMFFMNQIKNRVTLFLLPNHSILKIEWNHSIISCSSNQTSPNLTPLESHQPIKAWPWPSCNLKGVIQIPNPPRIREGISNTDASQTCISTRRNRWNEGPYIRLAKSTEETHSRTCVTGEARAAANVQSAEPAVFIPCCPCMTTMGHSPNHSP
jgi:hypothetical protein